MKIFVTDVDGTTLLKGEKEFNKEVKNAFKKIKDNGNELIVASGRTYRNLHKIFDYDDTITYISENGNMIVENGKILFLNKFKDGLARKIIEYLGGINDIAILVSTQSKALYYENGEVYVDEDETPVEVNFQLIDFINFINEEIIKISFYKEAMDEKFYEIYHFLINNFNDVEVFNANNNRIDVSPTNGNKGEAVKFVFNKKHINLEDLYAFGDGENDISMLKLTKNSYCPNHALDVVKKNSNHTFTDFALAVSSILSSSE